MSDDQGLPGEWAFVEIMGHRAHYGKVREVVPFGAPMIEVVDAETGATHLYSNTAVFGIRFMPQDELDRTVQARKRWRSAPLPVALAPPERELGDDDPSPIAPEDDPEMTERVKFASGQQWTEEQVAAMKAQHPEGKRPLEISSIPVKPQIEPILLPSWLTEGDFMWFVEPDGTRAIEVFDCFNDYNDRIWKALSSDAVKRFHSIYNRPFLDDWASQERKDAAAWALSIWFVAAGKNDVRIPKKPDCVPDEMPF